MKWIHTEGNEDVVYIYKKELIQLYIIDLKKRKKRLLFVININTFNTKKNENNNINIINTNNSTY